MKNLIPFLIVLFNLFLTGTAHSEQFTIEIERNMSCKDNSTIGRLIIDGKDVGRTLELPWKNNETGISRIPAGIYQAKIRSDGKLKWRIELANVADREWVQIHLGNYQRQTEGCILVGTEVAHDGNACMVKNSRQTLELLAAEMSAYSAELGQNQSVPIKISVKIKD